MQYNLAKLDRLHIDQHKGYVALREIANALRFAIDHRKSLDAALANHVITRDPQAFRNRKISFRDELVQEHSALEVAVRKAAEQVDRLQAEHDRLQAEQQRRGELLRSCLEYLEARGIKPELTDARANYVGPSSTDRIVVA